MNVKNIAFIFPFSDVEVNGKDISFKDSMHYNKPGLRIEVNGFYVHVTLTTAGFSVLWDQGRNFFL